MQTPNFWTSRSLPALLLTPFSAIYWLYIRALPFIQKTTMQDINIPTICVGNVVAGGAGKSPTAISLANLLIKQGKKPFFVSKGYGGNFSETMQVDVYKHSFTLVGDEPLLLAQTAPCIVCTTRQQGCKLAKELGADVIILDDGLHDQSIKKHLTFLIIDGTYGTGNGLLLPAGPLRDTLDHGIEQSDIAIIVGKDNANIEQKLADKLPILHSAFAPSGKTPPKDKNYIAFAGIARPKKFFIGLSVEGYQLQNTFAFADHHPFQNDELEMLTSIARENDCTLITTSKDFVRIPAKYHQQIAVFNIDVAWQDEQKISNILQERL